MELSTGSITIDGIDISSIGLDDLRSKLSVIPQVCDAGFRAFIVSVDVLYGCCSVSILGLELIFGWHQYYKISFSNLHHVLG